MIMIVFSHFAVHGGFTSSATVITLPRLWFNLMVLGGKLGVDVFILISGYFLIENDTGSFKLIKIAKFWGQVFFYSIVLFVIGGLTGITDMSIKSWIKAFMPISYQAWWFASTYFVLYLLHPFLNKWLRGLSQPLYQRLILLLVVCWSIIPTVTKLFYEGNNLLWFITLYAIAGYIRLYGLNEKFTTKHYFIFWLICSVITYSSSIVIMLLAGKSEKFPLYVTYFFEKEKTTTLLIAVSLFMIFATLKVKHRKWINVIASATFGVYLIHDSELLRPLIWLKLFKNAQYQDSALLIPYSIGAVIAVYVACSLIDLFRLYVIEKPFMMLLKRCPQKKTNPLGKFTIKLKNFIFGKQDSVYSDKDNSDIPHDAYNDGNNST